MFFGSPTPDMRTMRACAPRRARAIYAHLRLLPSGRQAHSGNITPLAEFNFAFDPRAANFVMEHAGLRHACLALPGFAPSCIALCVLCLAWLFISRPPPPEFKTTLVHCKPHGRRGPASFWGAPVIRHLGKGPTVYNAHLRSTERGRAIIYAHLRAR